MTVTIGLLGADVSLDVMLQGRYLCGIPVRLRDLGAPRSCQLPIEAFR